MQLITITFLASIAFSSTINCSESGGRYPSIFQLSDLQNEFDNLQENDLLVLDIDDTTIVANDVAKREYPKKELRAFKDEIFKGRDLENEIKYFESIQWCIAAHSLIDPKTPDIVANLQKKNIRVIALTHMRIGKTHKIEDWHEWRYSRLKEFGIDLAHGNPESYDFGLMHAGKILKEPSEAPAFRKGVLATSRSCSKGEVLAELIRQLPERPNRIIFVDDYVEHLDSVAQAMKEMGIDAGIYESVGTKELPDRFNPSDSEKVAIAKLQYERLINNHEWLSDEQARELFKFLLS